MKVYLAVCHGIGEIEVKLFSQSQWEDVISNSTNFRGSSPLNDAVMSATEDERLKQMLRSCKDSILNCLSGIDTT